MKRVTFLIRQSTLEHVKDVAKRNNLTLDRAADNLLANGNIIPLFHDIPPEVSRLENEKRPESD